jgi:hypothetical protein
MNLCYLKFLILSKLLILTWNISIHDAQLIQSQKWFTNQIIKINEYNCCIKFICLKPLKNNYSPIKEKEQRIWSIKTEEKY